ncbi:SDR family NAD(P)-dependent oxidoreductase [Neobacillus rhizophilus]|uniref:SDR family oxidoreductase n=1 Tax=Neobacillus rhizophilus TaxID=2833579 RepID=A0A942YWG9_9BACI|nr:SDR family NAD(P)-dependent oxidoreductase [Neobacillus rhizophilus]MBS4214962.1 SDR family oxidoreductase [Neobacillus rhizophilus]
MKDKVVVITGAASGIGRKTASLFAEKKATVVINDINEALLKEVEQDLLKTGATVTPIIGDVSKNSDVQSMMAETIERHGKLDILCNNAGVWWPDSDNDVVNLEEEIWDKIISINLKSVYLCSKYAIPKMIDNRGGSIINIASMAALRGWKNMDAYTASKGGIVSLTKSMAIEYGKYNIRVNAICPGSIRTPLTEKSQDEVGYPSTPLGRVGLPEDIGKTILFLASDDSAYLTGGILPIDGGRAARQ